MIKEQLRKEINKPWTPEQWNEIKEKAKKKKEKWANEWREYGWNYENVVTRKAQNGENYGFTLKPPYSQEELQKIIKDNKIERLPDSLYYYLTHISREICCDSYPHVFDGYLNCTKPSNIPLQEYHINADDLYDDDFEPNEKWPDEKNGTVYVPFAQIGEGGCTFSTQIILYGNQAGSVWVSDTDTYSKTHETFQEYLYRRIC